MRIRSRRENFFLILSLGVLNALTPFTIDLYLPAFPDIARELGVAVSRMSLTVSIYFIGFASGQLVYGPLLDRFGRKPPIYAGLALYILGTLGCMSAHSFEALLAFRLLSALGGSVASVASMTFVRDSFPAKDASRIFSMLMLVLSVSPLLAPTIGSFLLTVSGWRVLFGALVGLAVVDLLLVTFVIPSDYAPDRSVSLRPSALARTLFAPLREPQFRRYTFAGSLSFAGLFVFVAGSPALFMEGFGLDAKQFGGVFAILAGAMILGGQLNHLLVKWADGRTIFRRAVAVQVFVALLFLVALHATTLGLAGTIGFLFFSLLFAGITYPHAAALALAPFTRNIGSASSVLGFLQLGLGSLAAALVGMLNAQGARPMAIAMAVCTLGAAGVLGRRDPVIQSRT